MIVVALLLTASIRVELDLGALLQARRRTPPTVVCNISTVGYRFEGTPGQEFRYAGDTYVMPVEGSIELLADPGRRTYSIGGKSIRIDESPRDQFGFRTVVLQSPKSEQGNRP